MTPTKPVSLQDKVKSIGEQVGGSYRKPSPEAQKSLLEALWGNNEALDYLRIQRNLTDDTIKHFQLGYDVNKNAISIPIFKRGELINIKYRFLDPQNAKYSQEKDCEVWLYHEEGIQYGMKVGGVLIVEGEFDLMSCYQAGIKNVISPASGKDSYGMWLELIDNIPRVWISYDNDKPGKEAGFKLAERVGVEKSSEVLLPEGIKDSNEYFKKYTKDDFKELIKTARPFYRYQFSGVGDIINDLRYNKKETIKLQFLPDVKLGNDWLVVVSGVSNAGKTSYVMNLAKELVENKVPTLVLPFERGTQVVGTRFLQVKYNYAENDFQDLSNESWDGIVKECVDLPLYFAMPNKAEVFDVIKKAKRIFDIKVVIVDHLDYMIRSSQHKDQEIGTTLQEMKRLAEEHNIIMILVTHVRKIETAGSSSKRKKPNIEDLKGSSSLYQDPECVAMLSAPEEGFIEVDIVKNKGKMKRETYGFNRDSGVLTIQGRTTEPSIGYQTSKAQQEFDDF